MYHPLRPNLSDCRKTILLHILSDTQLKKCYVESGKGEVLPGKYKNKNETGTAQMMFFKKQFKQKKKIETGSYRVTK